MVAAQHFRQHREGPVVGVHLLDVLFLEAECYYMLDAYKQLYDCACQYDSTLTELRKVQDEERLYLYKAYSDKMWGAFYYGMTDEKKGMAFRRALGHYQNCYQRIEHDAFYRNALLMEMAQLFYKVKDYQRAKDHLEAIVQFYTDIVGETENDDFYNVESQLAMCNARLGSVAIDAIAAKDYFNQALQQIQHAAIYFRQERRMEDEYYETLRKKGKILMMQQDRLRMDNVEAAKTCYQPYISYLQKSMDADIKAIADESIREQHWLAMHSFLFDCYRLGSHASEMLYDLALYSKGYLLEVADKNVKYYYRWTDVRKRLGKDECAIEFVQYYGKNDAIKLAALLITADSEKPAFIPIADVDSLEKQLLSGHITLGTALASVQSSDKNAIYMDERLPKQIWTDELMKAINGVKNIYFSPDGILQQLAIEYLMPDTSYNCRRLTSTRLLLSKRRKLNDSRILLCGGINYGKKGNSSKSGNDDMAYRFMKEYASNLMDLPGTKKEIDSIAKLRDKWEDYKLEGEKATDEVFCNMANQYPLVHIATHGFFLGNLEKGTDLKPLLHDHSMSQSGLCFSGAQYALKDSTYDSSFSDGLLSAKEISQVLLNKVELIVLSACQTGLGYITADGVYGIQRALKMAGVKAMIVSLWNVNDYATSYLMMNFYKYLKMDSKGDVYDAFQKARRQLMTQEKFHVFSLSSLSTKKKYKYAAPQYANAFILIDVL